MSRKSGFSKGIPLEGPSVNGQLPHHPQALRWCGLLQIRLPCLIGQFAQADYTSLPSHGIT
jgi:hypothetical protein